MKNLIICLIISVPFLGFAQDSDVRIKVIENKLDKIYTVRFGALDSREIKVKILDVKGKVLFADSVRGLGFQKQYDLNKLSNGLYTVTLEYGGTPFTQDIFLQSKKELIKESIAVVRDTDRIKVAVSEYNNDPVSVFFIREDGSSAGYDYFDNQNVKEKIYSLSKFSGASIMEVVQNGEVMVRQTLSDTNMVGL